MDASITILFAFLAASCASQDTRPRQDQEIAHQQEKIRGLNADLAQLQEELKQAAADRDSERFRRQKLQLELDEALRKNKEKDQRIEGLNSVITELEEGPEGKRLELEKRKLALEEKRLEAQEVAAGAKACAGSRPCANIGTCGFISGYGCRPTTDAHCRRSKACRFLGRCHLSVDEPLCVAITNDDCRRSLGCKEEGKCTAGSDGACY